MASSFTKRLLIHLAITMALFGVMGIAIAAIGFDLSSNADQLAAVNANIGLKSRINTDMLRLRSQAADAEELRIKLESRVISYDSLFDFSGYVKSIADKHNLISSPVKFGGEIQVGFKSIQFSTAVQGEYLSLMAFLDDFEASPYFININNLALVSRGNEYILTIDGFLMFK